MCIENETWDYRLFWNPDKIVIFPFLQKLFLFKEYILNKCLYCWVYQNFLASLKRTRVDFVINVKTTGRMSFLQLHQLI
jgi:hypothetical protein